MKRAGNILSYCRVIFELLMEFMRSSYDQNINCANDAIYAVTLLGEKMCLLVINCYCLCRNVVTSNMNCNVQTESSAFSVLHMSSELWECTLQCVRPIIPLRYDCVLLRWRTTNNFMILKILFFIWVNLCLSGVPLSRILTLRI